MLAYIIGIRIFEQNFYLGIRHFLGILQDGKTVLLFLALIILVLCVKNIYIKN